MLCATIRTGALGAALLFLGSAAAAPGDFDPSFGTDSVVKTLFPTPASGSIR